ncbi:MAG: ATPase [Bacteroidales bacterium]|nr:ATPase [Bacteroidales bacterium]
METPFIYGHIAICDNYTNRKKEIKSLCSNFLGLINTVIISPRRWGKTSLVNRVAEILGQQHSDEIIVCKIDVFNCRTEEQFYKTFANALLKSTFTAWDKFVEGARKYLGRFVPTISFSDVTQSYELAFNVKIKENEMSVDEILDLPQILATDTGKKIVVCIDEFQKIDDYPESLAFQQTLRAHWQLHDKVCYCLYGSKRNLLTNIFSSYNMPFYKFGDILFLQKIKREDWVEFIASRFEQTGKSISAELCGKIADTMQNHPYYIQQLSQQIWLRTENECNTSIFDTALTDLIAQLSLLFTNIIDALTAKQINFLAALCNKEINFTAKNVLEKYDLGTSANIKNLKKALLEKDLIDILPQNQIVIQDPAFEYWLKKDYL